MLEARLGAIRGHLVALAQAAPRLPDEAKRAFQALSGELRGRPFLRLLLLVAAFAGLGAGIEWIFIRTTAAARARFAARSVETASDRARTIGLDFSFGLARVVIFGIGSIGAFLIFEWPPVLRRIVLAYLLAALVLRLAILVGRALLAPPLAGGRDRELRVIPMGDEAASFWYRRTVLFVGWFAFGWATVQLARTLGFSPDGSRLVAYLLGIGLLAIGLDAVWKWPERADPVEPEAAVPPARRHAFGTWLLSLYLVLLWVLWVGGMMGLFWFLAVALLLPPAIGMARHSVRHVLRPAATSGLPPAPGIGAVFLDRAVRTLLILGAALFLAWAWGLDLGQLTSRDTILTRLARGVLTSVVILLVADLLWQAIKTQIDRKLLRLDSSAAPGSAEALRQARVRTVLPIFRIAALVVVSTVAVLMSLSSLGIEIGPLIAGAGIIGIAVGFGAQTLVKDIFSGIFYLLDDAFRVGEYVQSGSYMGTVESLGFRSVKLRHHRGPIFTVPYGELGAVQNMSRDWAIDKMMINVAYDTDLDKAKKLIRQIGQQLAEDPEFAPQIIEPLKMQGVEQYGDFGIQLRMKMMTRPGQQFTIRRRALAMIKKAFEENGLRFAVPTVQVAGHEETEPAAAQQALKLIKAAAPPE